MNYKSNSGFNFNSYEFFKRMSDIIMAVICVTILSPVFIAAAFLVWWQDKHSPIYFHKRVGKNRELFDIYKFRSMVANADDLLAKHPELYQQLRSGNNKIKNDPRVTKLGKFIRKYSVDELPQMYNVLKGDMSVIGPRALRPDEYKIYEEKGPINKQKLETITSVKPGITGWWQVNGRSNVDFDSRMDLDVYYASKKSLLLDLLIILKTPFAVLNIKGAEGF